MSSIPARRGDDGTDHHQSTSEAAAEAEVNRVGAVENRRLMLEANRGAERASKREGDVGRCAPRMKRTRNAGIAISCPAAVRMKMHGCMSNVQRRRAHRARLEQLLRRPVRVVTPL